jgi:uncharacterized protein (DUF302 family)
MSYYLAATVNRSFEAVVSEVIERLESEGFGVLTDIDVQAVLKAKLGVDIPRYRRGACNHPDAVASVPR